MTQRAATALHVTLILIGALLYFLFVIPRWWVLTGQMPSTLATAGRIATGIPIALAAVPAVLTVQRSIKPVSSTEDLGEVGATPELALRLRAWSALLLAVGGGLILLAAIAEIWLGLGAAGPWLFAVYGGAGATAVLGALAYWLAHQAEKPPAPPKEPKEPTQDDGEPTVKKARRWLGKRGAGATADDAGTVAVLDVDEIDVDRGEIEDTEVKVVYAGDQADDEIVVVETEENSGGLRNQRPAGKRSRFSRR